MLELLYEHGEIINMQGRAINDLFDITNQEQIQFNIHTRLLNEHQNAVVDLFYNYNNIKERLDQDENIINSIGDEVNKVINFSIDTRNIVQGLAYQTQIHKDLIIQNYNDLIDIKEEFCNQAKFFLEQNEILKMILKKWKILLVFYLMILKIFIKK